ncbi:protein transport membrane glycoprotein Sec20, putative [Talaromyces stipitatus ATCC 10500]|uniref:Protein transport membrane glycoprotein Sec20, putative n=1 Tax=Talaromyces stipitatus (strain ATCC 10500 / CBS 375.48 / QM 6759 / NRRL 1006) TaxID=441959 RepID=B8MSC8_TALSN|nr:protein transport membrane glycoprotein Sec20, putative [Talaromyces stipitatus ATCC 10500]EED12315.1 protein transport membrane glycoprotein Sec20, putative [Talaromyces stipitatus ATCC 10500]
MSTIHTLQARLKETSNALYETKPLIDRLRNFTQAIGQGDEARLELGAEIHSRLKNVEEEMEILNVEVEGLEVTTGAQSKRKTGDNNGEKDAERKMVIGIAERLMSDLKRTRTEFRTAQLQANRNAEAARRKEREMLFARPSERAESTIKGSNKFTQNDIVVNASNDVTAALRRTHELMRTELSRSQFAQETLEQSTAALSSLSESYTNLDTVLSSTRTLVSSLLRSQKSDTWYLETSFYLLIGTIAWLVFRRILYGPMWWLAWMPVKMIYNVVASVIGLATISESIATTTSAVISATQVTSLPGETETASIVMDGADAPVMKTYEQVSAETENENSVLDKINHMVKGDQQHETAEEYDGPRNTKKRMWEEPVERRDEL